MDAKASQYDTIWNADDPDQEEFLSETDVDVSHEKQWHREEGHSSKWDRPRGFLHIIKKYRWAIDTSFLAVITALLILLVLRPTEPNTRQVGSDFTASGHPFSTKVIKWNADESFVPKNTSEFFSDALVAKWNTIMPGKSTGLVDPTSAKQTLVAGASQPGGPDSQRFSATSMTHQLHCLLMMGRIFSALQSNTRDLLMDGYDTHYLHCIDYIRQAAMCAGDVALEPHSELDGEDNGPLDGGWNGIHVCKNYDDVIGYLEGQIVDGTRIVLPIDD